MTTPSRTALDLAAVLPPDRLPKLLSELERLRLPDPVPLQELLLRHPQSRGSRHLRKLLNNFQPTHTRFELEDAFQRFLATTDLPTPLFNEPLILDDGRTIYPDVLWPDIKLIVELDSRDVHDTRTAFENDRARDRAAQVAGYRVIRVTWRQLHDEPARLREDLYRLHAR